MDVRPDILLVCAEWPERALLRAQLIEEGYEIAATDAWPIPKLDSRPSMTPRVMIVDLRGLPQPRKVLEELRCVIPPECVLVVTALATLSVEEVRGLGFHVMSRPASVGEIVRAAARLLRAGAER
jgi:hypothetical protein